MWFVEELKGDVVNFTIVDVDKKLLRYLTVKVKEFDLDTNYFSKKDDAEKKDNVRN